MILICLMCCVMFRLKKHFHHACRAFLTKTTNCMDIFMYTKSKVLIQSTFCQQI